MGDLRENLHDYDLNEEEENVAVEILDLDPVAESNAAATVGVNLHTLALPVPPLGARREAAAEALRNKGHNDKKMHEIWTMLLCEQGQLGNLEDLPQYPEAQSTSNPEFNLQRDTVVEELGPVFVDGMIIEVPHIIERDLQRFVIDLDSRRKAEMQMTRWILGKDFDTVVQDLIPRKHKETSTIYFLRFANNVINERLVSRLDLLTKAFKVHTIDYTVCLGCTFTENTIADNIMQQLGYRSSKDSRQYNTSINTCSQYYKGYSRTEGGAGGSSNNRLHFNNYMGQSTEFRCKLYDKFVQTISKQRVDDKWGFRLEAFLRPGDLEMKLKAGKSMDTGYTRIEMT
jgi:hypothetical protein